MPDKKLTYEQRRKARNKAAAKAYREAAALRNRERNKNNAEEVRKAKTRYEEFLTNQREARERDQKKAEEKWKKDREEADKRYDEFLTNQAEARERDRLKKEEEEKRLNAERAKRQHEYFLNEQGLEVEEIRNSFDGAFRGWEIKVGHKETNVRKFMLFGKRIIFYTIDGIDDRIVKYYFILTVRFSKRLNTGEEILHDFKFESGTIAIVGQPRAEDFTRSMNSIIEKVNNHVNNGSGWTIDEVIDLRFFTTRFVPFSGSGWEPLPSFIANKKAVINPKNNDNKCFMYAVSIYRVRERNIPGARDLDRIPQVVRDMAKTFNWDGVEFPVKLEGRSIERFESNNRVNVCVFSTNLEDKIVPVRNTYEYEDTIILFLCEGLHYCAVTDCSRLLSSQISKRGNAKYICIRCFVAFGTDTLLRNHKEQCRNNEVQRNEYPKPYNIETEEDSGRVIKPQRLWSGYMDDFEREREERGDFPEGKRVRYARKDAEEKALFTVYGDIECFTEPVSDEKGRKYQKHVPNSMAFVIKCSDESLYADKIIMVMDDGQTDVTGEAIAKLENEIRGVVLPKMMSRRCNENFLRGQHLAHERKFFCSDCPRQLKVPWMRRIRGTDEFGDIRESNESKFDDHCMSFDSYAVHSVSTGRYLRTVCERCYCRIKRAHYNVNVFFHNLEGYDAHLFVRKLRGKINCIPKTEERYVGFTDSFMMKAPGKKFNYIDITFKDSIKFMAGSLATHVKRLKSSEKPGDFSTLETTIRAEYGEDSDLEILKGKLPYPYDFMTDLSKFSVPLPGKEEFHNKKDGTDISDEDYERVSRVYEKYRCRNMKDLTRLYLLTDICLLGDVFEKFRDLSHGIYKLDPAHFYTAPGLSWEAMLKYTGVTLDLITDPSMHLMIERGIRGGVSTVTHRHSVANNKYIKSKPFDSSKPSKFIVYLDVNNLYGHSMSRKLPFRNFRWMTEQELENWRDIPCILEVDLIYPEEKFAEHNDLPLAPEHLTVDKVKKLVPNFYDKEKYVLHYVALKDCVKRGLIISKIHRGITFEEKDFLESYITLNNELRKEWGKKDEFKKALFKLMNNSVYGKTIENKRNRVNIKLINTEEELLKLSRKPTFKSVTDFGENLHAVHLLKDIVVHDKPTYLGLTILDLSKELLYRFFYDYIKRKFGDRAKLLFTDTDSLCLEIQSDDYYEEVKDDLDETGEHEWLDTSGMKENGSNLKIGMNEMKLGYVKSETGSDEILEFVGLRSKLYSYVTDSDHEGTQKMKGVTYASRRQIKHDDMKSTLFSGEDIYVNMNLIRSKEHVIHSVHMRKKAVSVNDTKRVILEDKISTVPIGPYGVNRDGQSLILYGN